MRASCVRCGHRSDHHNAFGTMPCGICDCSRLRLPEPKVATSSVDGARLPKLTDFKFSTYLKEAKRCEDYAHEVIRQCELLRVNGAGDETRAHFIQMYAKRLMVVSERMYRRSEAQAAQEKESVPA